MVSIINPGRSLDRTHQGCNHSKDTNGARNLKFFRNFFSSYTAFKMLLILLAVFLVISVLCILDWIVRAICLRSTLKLENSHVMITGGSSGIGLATAVLFASKGANITLVARNKMKLAQAALSVENARRNEDQKICIVSVDLSKDFDIIKKAIEEANECNGPVDLLVNCAGYAVCGTFQNTSPDDFKNMMETNYFGGIHVTKCVIDEMVARKNGHIVFVSSVGGQLGLFGYTAYSSSKFAIRGLAETLFAELKPHNIGVSVVFPPDTDTPGFENENQSKPVATRLISETAGLFSAKEVAGVILKGVENRQFLVYCGLDGFAINTLTCGGAPASSLSELLIQIMLMGPLRLMITFYLWSFDRIVSRCTKAENDECKAKKE